MDFSETIEVKVFDKEEHFSVDSYFFAYFHDLAGALDQIRDAVRTHRNIPDLESPQVVLDTTVSRSAPNVSPERPAATPTETSFLKSASAFRLSSILRPFSDTISLGRSGSNVPEQVADADADDDDYTHISQRNKSSFIPVTTSPEPLDSIPLPRTFDEQVSDTAINYAPQAKSSHHTYPPSTSSASVVPNHPSLSRESGSSYWSVAVPSWLKNSRRVFGGTAPSESTTPDSSSGIKEMYSSPISQSGPTSRSSGLGDMAFSILDTPHMAIDVETAEKFRAAFAYDKKEVLLGCKSSNNIILAAKNFRKIFRDTFIGYCRYTEDYTSP